MKYIPKNRTEMGSLLEDPVNLIILWFLKLYPELDKQWEYIFNTSNHNGFDHYLINRKNPQIVIAIEDKNCRSYYQISQFWLGPNIYYKFSHRIPTLVFLITTGTKFTPNARKQLKSVLTHFSYPEPILSEVQSRNKEFRDRLKGDILKIFKTICSDLDLSIYYNSINGKSFVYRIFQKSKLSVKIFYLNINRVVKTCLLFISRYFGLVKAIDFLSKHSSKLCKSVKSFKLISSISNYGDIA